MKKILLTVILALSLVLTPLALAGCDVFDIGKEYKVTFYLTMDESGTAIEKSIRTGTKIENVKFTQRLNGKAVITWSTEKNDTKKEHVFDGRITKEMTLYACEYGTVITFNSNGGSAVNELIAKEGAEIELPTPTKTDYTFDGWYDSSNQKFTATVMPANSLTLTAKWTKGTTPSTDEESISFTFNYGTTNPKVVTVKKDANIEYQTVTKTGYDFLGWTNSADATEPTWTRDAQKATEAKTYYAVWGKTYYFTVKYETTIGTAPENTVTDKLVTYNYNLSKNSGITGKVKLAGKITDDGDSQHSGWSTTEDATEVNYQCGGEYEYDVASSSSITLYAVWKAIPTYTITVQFGCMNSNSIPSGTAPSTKTFTATEGSRLTCNVHGGFGNTSISLLCDSTTKCTFSKFDYIVGGRTYWPLGFYENASNYMNTYDVTVTGNMTVYAVYAEYFTLTIKRYDWAKNWGQVSRTYIDTPISFYVMTGSKVTCTSNSRTIYYYGTNGRTSYTTTNSGISQSEWKYWHDQDATNYDHDSDNDNPWTVTITANKSLWALWQ